MMKKNTMEELLPNPFKVYLNCDSDDFFDVVGDRLTEIREEISEKYSIEIEPYPLGFCDYLDEYDSEYNRYGIFVGKQMVMSGVGPDEFASDEEFYEFCQTFVQVVHDVLETWKERILELQEERKEKLLRYEKEGFDELLFAYYYFHVNNRALIFLKRLVKRYPNSSYRSYMKRVYRRGSYGLNKPSQILCSKLANRYERFF